MKCDLVDKCKDDGTGIHYHAFINGKHFWVCEACKKKHNVKDDHEDDDVDRPLRRPAKKKASTTVF